MLFSIIIFALSGMALIALIGLKMFQDRSEVLLFWPDAREKSEMFLRGHVDVFDSIAQKMHPQKFFHNHSLYSRENRQNLL